MKKLSKFAFGVQRKNVIKILAALILMFGGIYMTVTSANNTGKTTKPANPRVIIATSMGEIEIELFPAQAPLTVKNFLRYVDAGFYANTLFHYVGSGYKIQGGGFARAGAKGLIPKKTFAPVKNESKNGLKNLCGTVAMAGTREQIDSATSQFFINLADNHSFDHRDNTPAGYGCCVFGRVVRGMQVADQISELPTTQVGDNIFVPVEDVVILSIQRVKL